MASTVLLFSAVLFLATAACEPEPTPARSTQSPPETDVDLVTHQVSFVDEVLQVLGNIGWEQALVLEDGTPNRLLVWEAGGHFHARVDYGPPGVEVSIVQAEGEGLPPGKLVRVRGEDGVRAGRGLYWTEEGFVVSLSPGTKALAATLTWLPA
jgi:hypothetical protein